MHIDCIEVYRVSMPLVNPFRTAIGDAESIESILVKILSGDDFGWGEACSWAFPGYSSEWAGGTFIMIRDWLAPRLLGQEIDSAEQLQEMLAGVRGNFFAKAGLDLAWWDLHSRRARKPLWQVLGGEEDLVDVGADFGVKETIDVLLETIGQAVEAGFKRVKLKYRPGWELNMVRAVRERFPEIVLHVDCNGAYRLEDAPMFRALDEFDLAMIEQPLAYDDLVDHAKLQGMLETPICLDESITSPAKARKAIDIGACQWINIKPPRVGGLTQAVAIHNLSQEAGVPCWVGSMLESAVGASHCVALATLPNFKYPADVFPSSRFYAKDLAKPEIILAGPSQARATDRPGIGCEPDPGQLKKCQLEAVFLSAKQTIRST